MQTSGPHSALYFNFCPTYFLADFCGAHIYLCRDIEYFSFSVKYEVQHNLAIRISITVMQHLQVKSFVGVKQGICEITFVM